ncbi:MAG: hypothetical protein DHS20C18_31420 [Saprospiraceae bacterium]|nr:MAG: hypothetical protein DHS20C18_31420 [Saprospiraceae bacterium]
MRPKHFLSLSTYTPAKKALFIPTIQAEVIFGRPSRGCDGVGICQVMVEPIIEPLRKSCDRTKVALFRQNDFLVFQFQRNQLCPCLLRKQFRRDYFLIAEPVELPEEIQFHLEQLPPLIQPGCYPILFKEETIEILIQL